MTKGIRANSKNPGSITEKLFFKLLNQIDTGQLTLIIDGLPVNFSGNNPTDLLETVTVNNKQLYRRVLLAGSNGAAESYVAGDWDTDDLPRLLELILSNSHIFQKIEKGLAAITNFAINARRFFSFNHKVNARKNIGAHYDLNNDFFATFLDQTMMYSAAVYSPLANTLQAASLNKLRIVCEKLKLTASDHLLEIGTGWGGLAIFAAREYGCKVTTTTISEEQYKFVKEKILALNLTDKITLLKKDYRDLTGEYDKVVSIEMIEAVGHQYFDTFFKCCADRLRPDGLLFLQAITINEKAYLQARTAVDFIKKYIFPGGCLPAISVICNSVARQTSLQLLYLQDIGEHYVTTLQDWLTNFNKNIESIYALGFDERFVRMWKYYLSYCMAGFRQSYISDIHVLWQKK
jgi:cyclopropane-fatty-acyl-phospholipid synthase